MSDALIRVENLWRRFDVSKPWLNRVIEREERQFLTAVADVNFEIRKGETFALVGESGSGKSTIAKMVVGLIPVSSGRILFDGTPVTGTTGADMRAIRRRFQMIFQDPFASLNPRWRVGDIIAEPIHTFGLASGADAANQVGKLLDTVGLSAKDAEKYPHEFSGGQRQRIAIARALSSRPEFIVCDEPTSALDVSVQAQILNLMRDLQDELGLTYLFISHDLSVVRHMANRIGVLYLGRLVEVSEGKSLFRQPQHPYTRMLLDAVPDLAMSGRRRKPVEGEIPNPINPPSGCAFHPRCPVAMDRCKVEAPKDRDTPIGRAACFALEMQPA
ncbi:ATP-binding cassette domain-containing protein [Microvirga tunisiensis]|uniref:ATP-binding cassette domain-containing protein n=2 Tax=Pannonibacter tanglangensis TaxID=2750084 RepID=A0A7X5F557_9HYPH|nr:MULTISPECIES: ABC transporter ATP-binding protein [unclassified Pannonibacter]NBN65054.1 ATP-binding cassette domain-containing protein [Pannonibacter sp. XCT-34]NBN79970.1 ATP-binding cassette domain-containing protein [Pannonibacter sp. XCT-53]